MNMKKHASKLLTLILALVITAGILAAKAPAEGRQYDYVMIEKEAYSVYISEGNDKFEERKVKDQAKDRHHQGPLFKLINEYEARGYEVYATNEAGYSSSGGTTMGYFILLRKPK
jgi:ABC-type oligopeptide transport system substrate-binding subunit